MGLAQHVFEGAQRFDRGPKSERLQRDELVRVDGFTEVFGTAAVALACAAVAPPEHAVCAAHRKLVAEGNAAVASAAAAEWMPAGPRLAWCWGFGP
jgi:hypothetical protein